LSTVGFSGSGNAKVGIDYQLGKAINFIWCQQEAE
jgi:hypothetical protein